MIRPIDVIEADILVDDPVRPHISKADRLTNGREVYVLEDHSECCKSTMPECAGEITAVVCVAYTNRIPKDEKELQNFNEFNGSNAIFYTVWSYRKGAGRKIILEVAKHLKKKGWVQRYVTLSPLTEMAEKFHLRNGAKLIHKGYTCQNFEYFMEKENV